MQMADYDLAVVGGGPAGITAAIQASRSDLKVALFEKDRLGGLLLNANLVENYPVGEPGISGPDLVKIFEEHLGRFRIEVIKDEITGVARMDDAGFELEGNDGIYSARALVLATGTIPKELDIEGAGNIRPGRIYYELRDIHPLEEERSYGIIGGGDAVFDYSLNLLKYKSKVTILVRAGSPDCLPLLKRRVEEHKNSIDVRYNTVVQKLEEDDISGNLALHLESVNGSDRILVDYLMIAIGRTQNDSLLHDFIDSSGEALGTTLNTKTNIPGLYLAGDIRSGSYRQVGIAVGDGLRAAMMAAEYLAGDARS